MADQKLKNRFIIIESIDDHLPESSRPRVRVFQNPPSPPPQPPSGGDPPTDVQQTTRAAIEITLAMDNLLKTLERATSSPTASKLMGMGEALSAFGDAAGSLTSGQGLVALGQAVGGTADAAVALVDVMLDLAVRLDEMNVATAKATGYTKLFRKEMQTLAGAASKETDALFGLGASFADVQESYTSLTMNFKQFPTMLRGQRKELAQYAIEWERLGVTYEDTGTAFEALTRGTGGSVFALQDAVKDMYQFAQETGQSLGQVVKDFNQLIPDMARYGTDAKRVFKDLSKTARAAGIGVQEAFDISKSLDTFEGAADIVGKLNAQLGLRLNSIEIMSAEEAERLEIIKEEFNLRKNFDDLNRREQQAIAEIMNVNVDVARKLLSGQMDVAQFQKQAMRQEEAAREQTKAMEKFDAALQGLMIQTTFILESATYVLKTLSESTGLKAIAALAGIASLRAGGGFLMKILTRGSDVTYHPEGSQQFGSAIVRGGPDGFIQPVLDKDWIVSSPDGSVYAGTKLFGDSSEDPIKQMQAAERQKRASKNTGGDMGATIGLVGGLLSKTLVGQIGTSAADLGVTMGEGGDKGASIARLIGSGVGGVAGALMGGPLGAAIGMSWGRMIGGMFAPEAEDMTMTRGGKVTRIPQGKLSVAPPGMPLSQVSFPSTSSQGVDTRQIAEAVRGAVVQGMKESERTRQPTPVHVTAKFDRRAFKDGVGKVINNAANTVDPAARGAFA